jgi:predicted transposase/invertase (TIGR01784 family)
VNLENIPQILNEPIFQKAFQVAELANLSREQLTIYEKNLLDYWTTKGVIETAREEGRQEGKQAGLQEGRQAGRQEGLQEAKLEIARRLRAKGLSWEEIEQMTGLTREQQLL